MLRRSWSFLRRWLSLSRARTKSAFKTSTCFRPRIDALEDRTLLATIIVTDVGDGNLPAVPDVTKPGTWLALSLRSAINAANRLPGRDTITFRIPVARGTIPTIAVRNTALPAITGPVDIDGTNGGSLIRLDGSKLPAGLVADGLVFQGGDSTMKGMSITGFENGSGVVFDGVTRGNPARGITMGRNQLLEQNYIGTDPSGAAGLGNQIGVEIIASSDNTIGGAAVAQADGTIATPLNVISGNLDDGISIHSMNIARPGATPVFVTSQRNLIAGNFIGLAPDGKTALGNSEAGIFLGQGSVGNVIGGPAGQARTLHNVISGNTHQPGVPGGYGIIIDGVPRDRSPGNWIRGNFIGTDRSGTAKVPNDVGIQIEPGAIAPGNSPTLIGEVRPSPGIGVPGQSIVNDPANLISGNNLFGILLRGDRTQVLGNFIGTALDGVSGLSNGQDGIRIDNGGRNRDFSLNATG